MIVLHTLKRWQFHRYIYVWNCCKRYLLMGRWLLILNQFILIQQKLKSSWYISWNRRRFLNSWAWMLRREWSNSYKTHVFIEIRVNRILTLKLTFTILSFSSSKKWSSVKIIWEIHLCQFFSFMMNLRRIKKCQFTCFKSYCRCGNLIILMQISFKYLCKLLKKVVKLKL